MVDNEPADSQPRYIGRTQRLARMHARENPIKAVFLRTARAPRRADDRGWSERTDDDQISGINGHSDANNSSARHFDGGRYNVMFVGDRTSAKDNDELWSISDHADCVLDGDGHWDGVMRDARLPVETTVEPV